MLLTTNPVLSQRRKPAFLRLVYRRPINTHHVRTVCFPKALSKLGIFLTRGKKSGHLKLGIRSGFEHLTRQASLTSRCFRWQRRAEEKLNTGTKSPGSVGPRSSPSARLAQAATGVGADSPELYKIMEVLQETFSEMKSSSSEHGFFLQILNSANYMDEELICCQEVYA